MKRTEGSVHDKVWVEISKSALLQNIAQIRDLVKPAAVMAVVKSNAYGHGLVETARLIQRHTKWFVVDSLKEALELRQSGIKNAILIIGFIDPSDIRVCAKYRFSFVAYDEDVLNAIKKDIHAKAGSYRIHLKIETGTTRQGLKGKDLISFAKKAVAIPSVIIEGAYTHYANIEDTIDPAYAMNQLACFHEELRSLKHVGIVPVMLHTAATAAAILYPETRFDAIRLGISLYGHWPSREVQLTAKQRNIKLKINPVLSWKTVIAQVKDVKKGTPVSYGLTERVHRDSKIAVLPIGYWDGYDRKLSSIGHVLIRGQICKIIGRICMNMMLVDVTDVKGVHAHDEVVLIGTQKKQIITAEELAAKMGTIQYEFLTRINPCIKRKIIK